MQQPPQYTPPPMPYQQPQLHGYEINYNNLPYSPEVFQPISNTGRKKALLVGINYLRDPQSRLKGAINDALNMKRILIERYGFHEDPTSMVLLTDDQQDPWKQPTRSNITTAMQWLAADAQPGDSLFFHYSGHGSQVTDRSIIVRDTSGDEEDGLDETICPVDYRTAGQIVDDDIWDLIVKPLPSGCRLTALMDCCHSGTGMDLPYVFTATGTLSTSAHMSYSGRGGLFGRHKPKAHAPNNSRESRADAVLFSGCRDDQTSADTTIGFSSGGAMTNAFIAAITKYPNSTYIQLLYSMRSYMLSGNKAFTQIPQLSSGRLMDMNQPFTL